MIQEWIEIVVISLAVLILAAIIIVARKRETLKRVNLEIVDGTSTITVIFKEGTEQKKHKKKKAAKNKK